MTARAEWGSWTTRYDSAGQAPSMTQNAPDEGLSVIFTLDRLLVSLQEGENTPFAGAVGLSGELSVSVPEDFNLLGFLLAVNGHVGKTAGSQALVTCSIGHGTQSLEWPLESLSGAVSSGSSGTRGGRPGQDGTLVSDFRVECFTSDFNQAMVGIPPHPPMPPFPITISMQARRRAADESVEITVTDFSVILIRSL